jgi:hypothetical protein
VGKSLTTTIDSWAKRQPYGVSDTIFLGTTEQDRLSGTGATVYYDVHFLESDPTDLIIYELLLCCSLCFGLPLEP